MGWLLYIDAAATGLLHEEGGSRAVALTAVLPDAFSTQCEMKRGILSFGVLVDGRGLENCLIAHCYAPRGAQIPLVIATMFLVMLNSGVDLDSFQV